MVVDLTAELRRMAIQSFIFALWPTVFSDVCAANIEAPRGVRNYFLIDSPMSAIVLDVSALRRDF